jgi:hypothetical protein
MTALDWTMVGFITIVISIGMTVFIKELRKDIKGREEE